jgi:hypothetical protein
MMFFEMAAAMGADNVDIGHLRAQNGNFLMLQLMIVQ